MRLKQSKNKLLKILCALFFGVCYLSITKDTVSASSELIIKMANEESIYEERQVILDEEVYFIDDNLKHAINESLGKPIDSKIMKSDMKEITYFYGTYKGISDLTGLQYAINLEKVYLDNNEISDLSPLKNLVNITELELNDNKISDLTPLANLTNLKTLMLYQNYDIQDASPLANLTQLTLVLV